MDREKLTAADRLERELTKENVRAASNVTFKERFLIPILTIAIAVSISLAVMEALLRTFGFTSPVLHAEMFVVNEKDPLLPYSLQPGYSGVYGGGTVNIDPHGNRVVPVSRKIAESRSSDQIVILGDSVAFGQSLDDKDTIAANLQKQILESGKFTRVVLIAAPGYTSWNEYAALIRYTELSSVRTIVVIYVSNDMTRDNDYFKFREMGAKIRDMEMDPLRKFLSILYDHSRLVFLIGDSIKMIINSIENETNGGARGPDTNALAYSIEAIDQLNEFCRPRGINLVVAIYRDGFFYQTPGWFANYEHSVSSSLSAIGVDHFVLRWPAERLSEGQVSVSWDDSDHPSVEASQIIAAEIAAELAKRRY